MKKERPGTNAFRIIGTLITFFVIISIATSILLAPLTLGYGAGTVALIELRGPIITTGLPPSLFFEGQRGANDYVAMIDRAAEDDRIEAIVLRINSPGGSAVGSKEIVDAVKRASEQKPTVAYIHESGASGAYWAASATDHIIAHDFAITGSVGVLAAYLEFSELFSKYGVRYVSLTGGDYKDLGSPFRNLTFEEEMLLQAKIDIMHEIFYADVVALRSLQDHDEASLNLIRSGIFFVSKEAYDLGLIDQIGTFDDVETYLASLGIDAVYASYETSSSMIGFGGFVGRSFDSLGYGIGRGLGAQRGMVITS